MFEHLRIKSNPIILMHEGGGATNRAAEKARESQKHGRASFYQVRGQTELVITSVGAKMCL